MLNPTKRLFLLVTVIGSTLFLNGCKSNFASKHSNSIGSASASTIDNIDYANATVLKLDVDNKYTLENGDPLVTYEAGSKKSKSNYDAYTLALNNPGEYLITVKSLCKCFGYRKSIFVPEIYVDNDNIVMETVDSQITGPSFSLPIRMENTWRFSVDAPEKLNFIVFSDNQRLDEELANVGLKVTASYRGRYIVQVTKV